MIVKVTQEHIDKARKLIKEAEIRGDLKPTSPNCPVSLALKDTFKVAYAEVNLNTMKIGQFPENLIIEKPIPDAVYGWIYDFDFDNPVQPFEFELSLEGVKL